MSSSLSALFAPRSVAIIGASNNERQFGGRPIQHLRAAGFPGPIYPVNPNRTEVQGLPAYRNVADVEGQIDCAIISVSAEDSAAAIEACAAKGVRGAILFAAGFAEVGGEGLQRQQRVLDIAREAQMRILGPNCMGMFNVGARFYATFASALETGTPRLGNIGLVSQSGGYGGHILKHMMMRQLDISHFVTTGNESDVDSGEVLAWLAQQPETEVLVAYMEGVRSPDKLIAGLEAARRAGKPVIATKVGRTEAGRAAAASHTAALTGSDAVIDAVFREYGVYRARSTEELLDVVYAASKRRIPVGNKIGVISISGGIGVQIADYVSDAGLQLPAVSLAVQQQLKAMVPYCTPTNPIDMTGTVTTNPDILEKTIDIVLAEGIFDTVLVFLGITGIAASMAEGMRVAISRACSRHPDKLVCVCVTASAETVEAFNQAGLFVFDEPARAIAALSALGDFREAFRRPTRTSAAAPVMSVALDHPLNEMESKALLVDCGVPSPREAIAHTPEAAAESANQIGYPVAVKILSPDILHKSDCGGVALNLMSQDEVIRAARSMLTTVSAAYPKASIDGFLVGEMVRGGVECFIGVHRDATFGPVVTFGLGGTIVELIKDTAVCLAPVDMEQAHTMIRSIRAYPLLAGYRQQQPVDIEALARAIVGLSVLAAAQPTIATIEVNPLLVRESGVVALDAVIQTCSDGTH